MFALIPIITSGIIIYYIVYNVNLKESYKNLENTRSFVVSSMQNVLTLLEQIQYEASEDADILQYLNSLNIGMEDSVLKEYARAKLSSMYAKYNLQEDVFLLDSNGICVADALEKLEGKDLSNMDYFINAKQQGFQYITSIKRSDVTGKAVFIISRPVLGPNNMFLGVLCQSIDMEKISEKYINKLVIGKKVLFT